MKTLYKSLSLLFALFAFGQGTWAQTNPQYITDVLLIGNSSSPAAQINDSVAKGWKLIRQNLNAGCASGADSIYLLCKTGTNINEAITDFYIDTQHHNDDQGGVPTQISYDNRTYLLTPFTGGEHFVSVKGDLNSGVSGSADVHLYYTKAVITTNRAIVGINFNDIQSASIGANGDHTTGYNLNTNAGGDPIYMHSYIANTDGWIIATNATDLAAIAGIDSTKILLDADITLSSYFSIANDITVTMDLNGHTLDRGLEVQPASGSGQVIYIDEGGSLTIVDNSVNQTGVIKHGFGGIGSIHNEGALIINGGTIQDCMAGSCGGAISNSGTLTINGGIIKDCSSPEGGAIYNEPNGTITISGGTIQGCQASNGGAIYNYSGIVNITGGTITTNTASDHAGAIYNNGGTLAIANGTISGNTASDVGGVYNAMNGTATITTSTFTGNTGTNGCGALGNATNAGEMTINNTNITNNTAGTNGGGIWNGSILTVTDGTITGNTCANNKNGGGIYHIGTALNMSGNPVINNNTGNGTANNLYLSSESKITVTGAFTSGTHIGFTSHVADAIITEGYSTYNGEHAPTDYFHFDNAVNYQLLLENGEVKAWTQYYITEVKVIGNKDLSQINSMKAQYQSQGWTVINKDLNQGAGGAYIYLLYKTGLNGIPISDFYLRTSDNNDSPNSLTHKGRTYTHATYDGSEGFINAKGDLNNSAHGKFIHLYYTTASFSPSRVVTNVYFDDNSGIAVGENGGALACDLNKGAGGDYIYMHAAKSSSEQLIEVSNEAELRDAITLNNANIKLLYNINIENLLDIPYPNNHTVNIDLNDRILHRIVPSSQKGTGLGHVLQVRGGSHLIINDNGSSHIGKITGGNADNGGGIWIGSSAKVTINRARIEECQATGEGRGGAICNNGTLIINDGYFGNCSSKDGGAIYNSSSGKATINGGGFQNNSTTQYGGGAITNQGTLTVTGGTFTYNNSTGNGGGIYSNGTLKMQGNPVVSDNKKGNTDNNNLYLPSDKIINVTGAFTGEANIHVKLQRAIGCFTRNYRTHNPSTLTSDMFKSDDSKEVYDYDDEVCLANYHGGVLYTKCSWNETTRSVEKEVCTAQGVNELTSSTTELGDGFWVFNGNVTCNQLITVKGNASIILRNNSKLFPRNGIYIEKDKTLTIYSQIGTGLSGSIGELQAYNNDGPGIGGKENNLGGHLVIHGGYIKAQSDQKGAGIGGGKGEGSGIQSVTIYDGDVYATGADYRSNTHAPGAGIGKGEKNNYWETITIYGGSVHGTGGTDAAGIGGTLNRGNGTINIHGGFVYAYGQKGGAGIGGGKGGSQDSPINIYGGSVTARGGSASEWNGSVNNYHSGAGIGGGEIYNGGANGGVVNIYGGEVNAVGGYYSAGIGAGISGNGGTVTITGGTVQATGGKPNGGSGSISAIGSNGSNNGSLTFGEMMVYAGENGDNKTLFNENLRVGACQAYRYAYIAPCTHAGWAVTDNNDHLTHAGNCRYCSHHEDHLNHTIQSNGECACGYTFPTVPLADNADNSTTLSTYNNQSVIATLEGRTLDMDGDWNTLCLPFTLNSLSGTPLEGFTVKKLDNTTSNLDNGTLTADYQDATSIEAGKPYIAKYNGLTISTKEEWDNFARRVNGGNTTLSAKLIADITEPVTTMVGTSSNEYKGVFDGMGHTITVAYGTESEPITTQYTALFARVGFGATIKNLNVTGEIYTANKFAAGLVGFAHGRNEISDCTVSVAIHSTVNGEGIHGGLVAYYNGGPITISNCAFTGSLLGGTTTSCGGFLGWTATDKWATLNMNNCYFAPTDVAISATNCKTFTRYPNNQSITITNCYYTTALGDAQGTQTSATGNDLVAQLGNGWEVSGGKVVPKVENNINPKFKAVVINNATPADVAIGSNATLKSTYAPVNVSGADNTKLFLGDNSMLYYPQNSESLNAFRTYFQLNNGATADNLNAIILNWGNTSVQKFISPWTTDPVGGWYFIASPIDSEELAPSSVTNLLTADATVGEASHHTFDLYRLNDPKWENYHAHNSDETPFYLENGQSYLYANENAVTLSFNGTANADASKSVAITPGFNLVGNPFTVPAYINCSYYKMNSEGTQIDPVLVTSSTPIAPCTGVVVEASEIDTVTFSTTLPDQQNINQGNLNIAVAQQVVTRSSASNVKMDNAIVSFNEGNQLGKFDFGDNAKLYIPQDGKDYAIAFMDRDVARYVSTEIPVNFKATKNSTYTITVNPENIEMSYLHLIDNMTGADVDLLQTPSYTFIAKTTDYESRFKLVFVCGDADDDNEAFAFFSNGNIIVNGSGTLQVIDMLGRQLLCRDIHSALTSSNTSYFSIPHSAFPAGVYVLRLINGDDVRTQKIVID